MSNKTSHRKGSIFKTVLVFHACILLFILYVNDWFVIKIPSVQKEQPNLQEKEIQNEKKIREENAKDPINERRSATNKIYLPTQKAIEKQGEKIIEDVKKQPDKAIEEKTDLASKEYSPPEKAEKTEDITSVETAKSTVVEKQNNIDQEKVSASIPKQVSLPEKKDMVKEPSKINKPFNFNKYKAELIENYKVSEGENIPLLLIDDHDKSGLYKAGLEFYGYQLIARPVTPKEPYYFVISNSGIERIGEPCPYTGGFPSAIQGDRKLFNELLSQPQFAEDSSMEYELFYAPLDTEMLTIIKCKLRFIIEDNSLAADEISEMKVTFKEMDSSYILIIESIVTAKGKRIEINDPDNEITNVG